MVEDLKTQKQVEQLMSPDGGAVIIDFWSPTCGPCKQMAPAFDAVAREFEDEDIRFVKINTAAQQNLAKPFRIRAVPTLLMINNGDIVDVRVGALDGTALHKKAKWLIKKASGKGLLSKLFG